MDSNALPQGSNVTDQGVAYSVWAPSQEEAVVRVEARAGRPEHTVPLALGEHGYFRGVDPEGRVGDRFKVVLADGSAYPPAGSRFQPEGVHGPAEVVDARGFRWTDHAWQRPPFRDLVIYELHLGTFSPEGTYLGAVAKLPYLVELGVTAIEVMPVADFPGERGWGYDGVHLFAPARCYGTPDEFRQLVDAAHQHGLAVILDVVYNHFGPDGNYHSALSPYYFSSEDKTPWGDALNFGHHHSQPVREYFLANVRYWMEEFHMDGFRLDATHAIIDESAKHILQEIAETVQARGGYVIAEDERNEARIITPREQGGYGLNAVWADDFHHTIEVGIIENSVYKKDFAGDLRELVTALEQGWIYSGQTAPKHGKPRGTPAKGLRPEHFIYCISNHDQVGNRALGERLNHLVSPATYRAASALLLLAPYTPLLFQGQEWAASSPFQYFTDHNEELGRLVEKGRREEFKDAFTGHAEGGDTVPSPQAVETFLCSKLRWEELSTPTHAQVLALYKECLRLRKAHAAFRPTDRAGVQFDALPEEVLAMRVRGAEGQEWLVLCDLRGGHTGRLVPEEGAAPEVCQPPAGRRWESLLSTNESRFGGGTVAQFDAASGRYDFREPELLVLQAVEASAS